MNIIISLFDAAEVHYGRLATRLATSIRPHRARSNREKLRRVCGTPVIALMVLALAAIVLAAFLFVYCSRVRVDVVRSADVPRNDSSSAESSSSEEDEDEEDSVATDDRTGVLVLASTLLIVALLVILYPTFLLARQTLSSSAKSRLKKATDQLDRLRFEGFMQLLQQEVDALTETISCLDSFSRSQTRLVVFVDGLDNCEQERMVQTLDALELLFCSRAGRPFVVVIAVDPHIIISAINHNIHSALVGTELSGYHYLKNTVNLPFYLQNTALRRLHEKLRRRQEDLETWKSRFMRQETFFGSHISLAYEGSARSKRTLSMQPVGTSTLSQTIIVRDDYFSNINPRSMNRIVHALNLTGRLMRAFEVDFSWVLLGEWISMVEQWPYRVSHLIDYCDQHLELPESSPLKTLYSQISHRVPAMRTEDKLLDIDRNPEHFSLHLSATKGDKELTVKHLKDFVPCTSNLDPYIRKLIKDRRVLAEISQGSSSGMEPQTDFQLPPFSGVSAPTSDRWDPVPYLFEDVSVWNNLKPLRSLTSEEVASLVLSMKIPAENKKKYADLILSSNISGLVLTICEPEELREELKMRLGDWALFRVLLHALRSRSEERVRTEESGEQREGLASPGKIEPVVDDGVRRRQLFSGRGRVQSMEVKEAEAHQEWIEERFSRFDTTEFAGDDAASIRSEPSRRSSVRFFANRHPETPEELELDDDAVVEVEEDEASSCDSTTSMFGSAEKLAANENIIPSSANEKLSGELRREKKSFSVKSVPLMGTKEPDDLSEWRRTEERSASGDAEGSSEADEQQLTVRFCPPVSTERPSVFQVVQPDSIETKQPDETSGSNQKLSELL